jgi:hypothetical protein
MRDVKLRKEVVKLDSWMQMELKEIYQNIDVHHHIPNKWQGKEK